MTRRTIARPVAVEGVALHAGTPVRMMLAPAASHAGVVFRRGDLDRTIHALYDRVAETRLGTTIAAGGATVAVIEHLMAAIAGAGIDDLEIVLDGPEPPILDGDALSYLRVIGRAGVADGAGTRAAIEILRRVVVEDGAASASLVPDTARAFAFEIDFPSSVVGRQSLAWRFSEDGFAQEIAPARTFGSVRDLEALNKAGLARGASLENTLAIDGDRLVNASLQRFPDEFVRHKILDAIGDLALAGAPILGRFEGRRSGHALNNRLLRRLFANPANFRRIELAE